ncbi:hypothetical protein ACJ2A9_18715 [Anaerobacillus sp. MEB173]|uniref:hypothetical protein n=1 Tax=Anaerobacillus sp. MEB173 TaxID=3383345 RepID=UPI003F93442B
MNNEHFEDIMSRLKKGYNGLPEHSSPERIMQHIHMQNKNRKPKRQWMYAASILIVVTLGTILLMNQWTGTEQMASEDSAGHDLTPESAAIMMEEEFDKNNQESEMRVFIDDVPEGGSKVDRDKQIVKSILIEGMEEEVPFTLYVDEYFQFSTYLPEQFETEQSSTDEGTTTLIHPVFNGVYHENSFISISEEENFKNQTIDQIAENQTLLLEENGFNVSSIEESMRREIAVDHYAYSKGYNLLGELIIVEHNERKFVIKIQYSAELMDGINPRLDVIFSELEWIE